jgi:hypothetical protein
LEIKSSFATPSTSKLNPSFKTALSKAWIKKREDGMADSQFEKEIVEAVIDRSSSREAGI